MDLTRDLQAYLLHSSRTGADLPSLSPNVGLPFHLVTLVCFSAISGFGLPQLNWDPVGEPEQMFPVGSECRTHNKLQLHCIVAAFGGFFPCGDMNIHIPLVQKRILIPSNIGSCQGLFSLFKSMHMDSCSIFQLPLNVVEIIIIRIVIHF